MARPTGLKRAVALATPFAVAATALAQTPGGLVDLLIGEYNNNEQVWQQNLDGGSPVARVHWRFARLGDGRLGVSRALGQSAPAEPTWAYTFDGNVASVAPAGGGETACSYQWHEQSDGYAGVMDKASDCPAEFPDRLQLAPDYLVATYADDAGEVVHRARRVTRYRGWVAFDRRHIDPDAADDDFILMRDIDLHDEGFVVAVTDAGNPTGYAVELARLTYQNTRTAIVKLGIVDQSTGETVSYGWAEPGAQRIGINLRWVQAGMTRSP